LSAEVDRGGKKIELRLHLQPGWRKEDISWRATTWDLRRMGLGGLVLEDIRDAERTNADLGTGMALRVKHVGQYNEHAIAKKAGFEKDDIVVAFDGRTGRMSETDLLAYTLQQKQPGDTVTVTVLRNGQRRELSYRLQ
jgi:S1-C subfamily serine protease